MKISYQRLTELLNYDPETGIFTNRIKRGPSPAGKVVGHVDGGYFKINVAGGTHKAHRLAWLYMTGSLPAADTDHINGDKLDNRFVNLREATRGQNMMNVGVKKNNTSGYKGVSFYKKTGKWKAQIQVDKKKMGLGYFDDIKEAAEAYIFAALELHGDYTRIT